MDDPGGRAGPETLNHEWVVAWMSEAKSGTLHPHFASLHAGYKFVRWIPAFAGMSGVQSASAISFAPTTTSWS
jgi:hypothetical protein